jgi:diguanylate cyclase (GGDEF)-like protein
MVSVALRYGRLGFGELGDWVLRQPAWFVGSMATMAVVALGRLDYLNGPGMVVSMAYLVPLSAAAWRLRLPVSAALCLVTALIWEASDLLSGGSYSTPLIPIWNTALRLGIFVLFVVLLARLRDALLSQTRLASIDALTEVGNQRSFAEAAVNAMQDSRRSRRPLSVAFIDLDDFKAVNDTVGHSGGDRVLRIVANALTERTRAADVVARLGGDEFAILLPDTASSEAQAMMRGLTMRLDDSLAGLGVPVTFSAGVATFLGMPADVDALLRPADRLMYRAKAQGKAGFVHATVGGDESEAYPDTPTPRATTRR